MARALQVLLISADEESGAALGSALHQAGVEVEGVRDLEAAVARLRRAGAPEIALIAAPQGARELGDHCRSLRALFPDRSLQILALVRDATDLERAIAAGADEVVRLPIERRELETRLRSVRRVLDLHQGARGRGPHDPLTGLWNHSVVVEVLQLELDRAARAGGAVSVLFADLDRFAAVNDRHGHRAGDEVLREVAQRLRIALRSYDLIGRYGGDEFLVVLPNCGKANAIEVAQRMRRALSDSPILLLSGEVAITLSVGCVTAVKDDRAAAAECVRAAELALDHAKRLGRDRIEVAPMVRSRVFDGGGAEPPPREDDTTTN